MTRCAHTKRASAISMTHLVCSATACTDMAAATARLVRDSSLVHLDRKQRSIEIRSSACIPFRDDHKRVRIEAVWRRRQMSLGCQLPLPFPSEAQLFQINALTGQVRDRIACECEAGFAGEYCSGTRPCLQNFTNLQISPTVSAIPTTARMAGSATVRTANTLVSESIVQTRRTSASVSRSTRASSARVSLATVIYHNPSYRQFTICARRLTALDAVPAHRQ